MNINSDRLKTAMAQAGATAETLGAAIARDGLTADEATRALRCWMRGSNHPRSRPADIRAIAEALNCRVTDIARFVSTSRFVRSSPRKARLVADLIRGKRVDDAMNLLTFSDKRAAQFLKKTLTSAIADAEGAEADTTRLVVAESRVDAGATIKRFQPKDRGRAHQILKRTSHLVVGVEEMA